MDTGRMRIASVLLKAGRSTKEDVIDNSAGIILHKKYGDYVQKRGTIGGTFCLRLKLFSSSQGQSFFPLSFTEIPSWGKMLVYARVSRDETKRFD